MQKEKVILEEIESLTISGDSPVKLIKAFNSAQSLRVNAYNKFEIGFREYLETGAFPQYQQLTQNITAEFVKISNKIREIESELHTHNKHDLANIIRQIQNNEKEKLRLTAALQVYRKSEKDLLEEEKFIEPMLQQEKKRVCSTIS